MIIDIPPTSVTVEDSQFDFVIVGSGAGGALAARLAECGYRVLVLEAGADHFSGQAPTAPVREVSSCPATHAASTERAEMSWKFFVDHYTTAATRDPKWNLKGNGLFYPRATGIGGCTIHNAMITIIGPANDWDALAWYLNDPSWNADVMRGYFRRLERCEYQERWRRPQNALERFIDTFRWLWGFDADPTSGRHGFDGWLHTSTADPKIGLLEPGLVKMLKAAVITSIRAGMDGPLRFFQAVLREEVGESLDPNHFRRQNDHPEGVALIPTAVVGRHPSNGPERGHRSSPVPRLTALANDTRYHLTVATNCLVTEVILEDVGPSAFRATGVRYLHGNGIYEASAATGSPSVELKTIHARKEVILCGGSFNTPQILMLSGIGPRDRLTTQKIPCRVESPGVGRNLQDRYEVTIVSKMKKPFSILTGAKFNVPQPPAAADPKLLEWRQTGGGLYSSNGAVLGIFKRSRPDMDQPDLFIFGIPLKFLGYEVGYSIVNPDEFDLFTWAILKGHTQNHGGTVELASASPTDRPKINFNYFGTDEVPPRENDPDLEALTHAVKFVRQIAKQAGHVVDLEFHPEGNQQLCKDATDDQIKSWIQRVAWGHHACGTCRMGRATDPNAVTDSRFRVLGSADPLTRLRKPIAGLRIVDASIFPTIPGYFIVSNLYTASEKAADVIAADYPEIGQ